MRKNLDKQDHFTTEDTKDTEEKQNEEKRIGVKSRVTVRRSVPPTFAVTDHQPLKHSNPCTDPALGRRGAKGMA
jgi:hypothetical protein